MSDIDKKRLSEQLEAAQTILDEIRVTCGCDALGPDRQRPQRPIETALAAAMRAKENRKARASFLGSEEIFGEPAWDLLLDLFVRQAANVTGKCEGGLSSFGIPTGTFMRWLNILENIGLVASHADPNDRSTLHVSLTPTGYEGMVRYLESISS